MNPYPPIVGSHQCSHYCPPPPSRQVTHALRAEPRSGMLKLANSASQFVMNLASMLAKTCDLAVMFDQFARQNRWWLEPSAIATDRHLVRLRASPLQWAPE